MPGLKVGGAPPGVGPGHAGPGPGAGPGAAPAHAAPAAPATGAGTGNVAIGRSPFASLPELPVAPTMLESIGLGAGAGLDPLNQSNYKTQLAMNQFAEQDAQLKTDDALLQRLSPAIRANPLLVNSPAFMQHIVPILQRRGIEVPLGPDGKPDANKLAAMIATAPPMTQTGITAIEKSAQNLVTEITTGKKPPQAALPTMLSLRNQLLSAGQDTSLIDSYLNADHTGLADGLTHDYLGAKTESDLARWTAQDAHLGSEDQLNAIRAWSMKAHEDDAKAGLGLRRDSLALQARGLSDREQKMSFDMSQSSRRLAMRGDELGISMRNLQLRSLEFNANQNTRSYAIVNRIYGDASKKMDNANSELGRLDVQIDALLKSNPKGPESGQLGVQFNDLMNRKAELTKQIKGYQDDNGNWVPGYADQLGQIQANIEQFHANQYGSITGTHAVSIPFAAGQPVPGKSGYKFTGAAPGIDENGRTIRQIKGPDGKLYEYSGYQDAGGIPGAQGF